MDEILKDINAVVGVTGSFVCNDDGVVLTGALPNVFDEAMLPVVGHTVARTAAGLQTLRGRKAGDIDLLYAGGRFIVKNLQRGYLCILCARNINLPLLNLTANVAARKLKELLKEHIREFTQAKPAQPAASSDHLQTMASFIELFIGELEKRGATADVILKAIQHRIGRLQTDHPCLALVQIVGEKVDLSALQTSTFSDEEITVALGALIQGVCWSAIGILGAKEAKAGYDRVCELFHNHNGAPIERIGLEAMLAKAARAETMPRLPGVDLAW